MLVRPPSQASTIVLVLSMLAAGGLATPAVGSVLPQAEPSNSSPNVESTACASDAETEAEARQTAFDCGTDIVVAGALTEWMTPTVDAATGDLVVEYSGAAVRQDSDGDGQWADVAVQVLPDPVADGAMAGLLPVSGGVEPIWLSPGGPAAADLPLAVIGAADERVGMLSASLPMERAAVSEVGADRVTYDFGQGVSLVVSVSEDGTSVVPVVRLADQGALEFLAGDLLGGTSDDGAMALEFPLQMSAGLTLQDAEVGFEVRDVDGNVAFESGPALMWDSAGEEIWDGVGTAGSTASTLGMVEATSASAETAKSEGADEDRLVSPASGDDISVMDVSVVQNTVVVVPDSEMLTDPATTFPVHLDPKIGASKPSKWTMVQSHWPTTATFSESGTQALGLCDPGWAFECSASNVQRLFWQFQTLRQGSDGVSLGQLDGSAILSATFSVYGTHSWDCSPRGVDVYATSTITSATTWNNQPRWGSVLSRWAGAHKLECDNRRRISWDVTSKARTSANNDVSWVAVGMRSVREDSMSWWKRYEGSSGKLTISFDRPPPPPTANQTRIIDGEGATEKACTSFTNRPQVRDASPTLTAQTSEPDGTTQVQKRFRVQDHATASTIWYSGWTAPTTASTWSEKWVPGSAGLKSGKTYRWQVQVKSTDGPTGHVETTSWSDSPLCYFSVDTEYPNPPGVTSSNYPEGQVSGGVGVPIEVTFSANGSNDVARYWYSYNSQTFSNRRTPSTKGGSVTLEIPVTRSGLNYVAVRSEDDAGLPSDSVIYEFYVGFAHKTGHWQFNDAGWQSDPPLLAANSLAGSGSGHITRSQSVPWVAGATPDGLYPPSTLPGSDPEERAADGALLFDGAGDVATTASGVVAGDQSYTISAFVRADEIAGSGAAVSQAPKPAETVDGNYRSGFHLGFSTSPDCPTVDQVPCWAFWQVRDNDPNSANVISRTAVPAVAGEWAHVVGIFDASAKTVRAWACPLYADPAKEPLAGPASPMTVDEDGQTTSWQPWNVGGGLRLGSGTKNGAPVWEFTGAVDEVRVYDGHQVDEAKLERICTGFDVP